MRRDTQSLDINDSPILSQSKYMILTVANFSSARRSLAWSLSFSALTSKIASFSISSSNYLIRNMVYLSLFGFSFLPLFVLILHHIKDRLIVFFCFRLPFLVNFLSHSPVVILHRTLPLEVNRA